MVFVSIWLTSLWLLCSRVCGTNVYISSNGTDSGDCSSLADACFTWDYALGQIAPSSDTAHKITIGSSTTISANTPIYDVDSSYTVVGEDIDSSIISFETKGTPFNGSESLTVSNLTVYTNTSGTGLVYLWDINATLSMHNIRSIEIGESEVAVGGTYSTDDCLVSLGTARDVTLADVEFESSYKVYGIYVLYATSLIINDISFVGNSNYFSNSLLELNVDETFTGDQVRYQNAFLVLFLFFFFWLFLTFCVLLCLLFLLVECVKCLCGKYRYSQLFVPFSVFKLFWCT